MDYEADEYDRPINPTGLFGGGGFGQRIFFKQNQYIAGVIDDLETHTKGPENFITSNTKDVEPEDPDLSDDPDVYTDSDDPDDVDPLETFLAALNLTEYWPVFKKEQIDLEGNIILAHQPFIRAPHQSIRFLIWSPLLFKYFTYAALRKIGYFLKSRY